LFHKFYYLLIPWSMGVFEGDIWGVCPKGVAERQGLQRAWFDSTSPRKEILDVDCGITTFDITMDKRRWRKRAS